MRIEEFESHPIHETVKQVSEMLDAGPLREDMTEDLLEVQELLARAFRRFRLILSQAEPALAPVGQMNTAHKTLQSAQSELSAFKSNRTPQHLSNASAHVDTAAPIILAFGPVLNAHGERQLTEVAELLRAKGEAETARLEERVSEIQEKTASFIAQVQSAQEQLTTLKQQIEDQKRRSEELVAQFQSASQQREDERTNSFTAQKEKFAASFEQLLTKTKTDSEAVAEKLKVDAKEASDSLRLSAERTREELDHILARSRTLYELIGDTAVTGKFGKTADVDSKSADRFRRIAIVLFLTAAVILFWSYVLFEDLGWKGYLARLSATLMLVLPAIYAIRESSRHRDSAARNRRIQLELASLDPFISNLTDEEKLKIKNRLVDKYFGKEDVSTSDAGKMPTGMDIFRLLGEVVRKK